MRFSLAALIVGASAVGLVGCATMPEAPPNAPPMLPFDQQVGDPGVPFSAVIAAAGEATASPGAVAAGERLLQISYRYKHTAVLTEDVTGYSITVPGVQAPAGSPGYYAGTFLSTGGPGANRPSELWCFLPREAGGTRETLCLLRNQPGIAAIAPTRMNPYLWTSFAPATGTFDYVHTPIYERRDAVIPGDLVLEYRFRGWTRAGARVQILAVGRDVQTIELTRPASGPVILRTVAGAFEVTPAADDSDKAVIRRTV